jgi:archaemetzincin
MPAPRPGDWLSSQHEAGQSFQQYVDARPIIRSAARPTIYLQPLGTFSTTQLMLVTLTAECLRRFYQTDVCVHPAWDLAQIPASARRGPRNTPREQLLTTYVLYTMLAPRIPSNALMFSAITTSDLYAGSAWNFVFGQAALRKRVGVYSMARFGRPDAGAGAFTTCLWRTVRTALHETGHMLGMKHCIRYRCGMNGSNSLFESDRRPLAFCPQCLAKLCWAMQCSPLQHCSAMQLFCTTNNLTAPARLFARQAELLRAASAVP